MYNYLLLVLFEIGVNISDVKLVHGVDVKENVSNDSSEQFVIESSELYKIEDNFCIFIHLEETVF